MKDKTISKSTPLTLNKIPPQGEVYKSYKDLCAWLNIPCKGGNAKKAQLKELQRFFKWKEEGNKFIITEILNQPLPPTENRGGKDITEDTYLCYLLFLFFFRFGERDEEDPTCITASKTELKQKYLKLINQDYFDIRKTEKSRYYIEGVKGVKDTALDFADKRITGKANQIVNTALNRLEKEKAIYISNRYYIYYIDSVDYEKTGRKTIKIREANHSEITVITDAGWISEKDLEEEYTEQDIEKKYGYEKYQYIKKKMLKLLNGVEGLEEIDKYIKEGKSMVDLITQGIREGIGSDNKVKGNDSPQERILVQEKGIKGLNNYALKKGEIWINIVDKYQIFPASNITLVKALEKTIQEGEKLGFFKWGEETVQTLTVPRLQLKNNSNFFDWIEKKIGTSWTDFSHGMLNKWKSGSENFTEDMKKINQTFVALEGNEVEYSWRDYRDENGKIWTIRWSNTPASFNKSNMGGELLEYEEGKTFVLWNTPHLGWACSNDGKLIEKIRDTGVERGWMPIRGHLGGVKIKGIEKHCLVLILDAEKIEICKKL